MSTLPFGKSVPTHVYKQLETAFDSKREALWFWMNPAPRPCFNWGLVNDILDFQNSISSLLSKKHEEETSRIRYLVFGSRVHGVFNLGGDLDLFRTLIRGQDREQLAKYAEACITILFNNMINLGKPITTISLVEGDALGGGFEAALSSNVVIAERSAQMGFPEVMFNLIPGHGAFSLLSRRIGPARAGKMILSGRLYRADELYDMGLIDVLAEDGEGEQAVHEYIHRQSKSWNSFQAVQKLKHHFLPISFKELADAATVWVETALGMEQKHLRIMDRLIRAQDKLSLSNNDSAPPQTDTAVVQLHKPKATA